MDDSVKPIKSSLPRSNQVTLVALVSVAISFFHYQYTHYYAWFGDEIVRLFLNYDFGSFFSPELAERIGSTPLAIFWILFSVLVFGSYYVTTTVWDTTKKLVSLEVSELSGNIDDYNKYRFKRIMARSAIMSLYFLPYLLGIFVLMPFGDKLIDYFASIVKVENPIWHQVLVFAPAVLLWTVFISVAVFIHNLANFSQKDVEIEEEHNAMIENEREAEDEE